MGKVLGLRKKPSGSQVCYHLGHFALAPMWYHMRTTKESDAHLCLPVGDSQMLTSQVVGHEIILGRC